jgi:acyl-CoA dehydrogenase
MSDIWQTPERVALRRVVRDFADREVLPHLDQWEADGELPRELHKRAADAGLLGVAFPESAGGQGGNGIDAAIVT